MNQPTRDQIERYQRELDELRRELERLRKWDSEDALRLMNLELAINRREKEIHRLRYEL